jgi:hypothetical protein
LVFKSEIGNRSVGTKYGLSAVFHAGRFPFLSLSCLTLDNIRKTEPSRFAIQGKMSNVTRSDIGTRG